uniref:Uncharacterized protein n=1 Tax=uncultured marine thaumarchaeote KM3_78_E10 TaxID=1456292 RepID=A0A075HV44_9ARCH|nr:hypothetical protein [uncultured marine thaumarchaeote KM3_78_E10]
MFVNLYSEDLKLLENIVNKFLYNILIMSVRKKMQMLKLIFLFFAIMPVINLIPEAEAHALFNSGEEWIGDYRVQIATLPEIPAVDEEIQVLFQVVDGDFQELDQFTMGIRVFYDGEQIDAIMPKMYQNGHMEMDYIFEMSGNHIFRVDLYDISQDGRVLTYTFNIGAQNTFGFIFIGAITMGGIMTAIIFIYVYFSRRKAKST